MKIVAEDDILSASASNFMDGSQKFTIYHRDRRDKKTYSTPLWFKKAFNGSSHFEAMTLSDILCSLYSR
jgi:hypothetical protein